MKIEKSLTAAIPFDESVELLKKLVSENTVNPPGNERKLELVIKEAFAALGAEMEIVEKEKGRANFIGKIGSGSPTVGFFPHLDTVPPGDGWDTDPFTPTVKDGKLYARGVEDSKGNFASSWAAIKAFLTRNKSFNGTIYLVGCADEETGSSLGVRYLLKKGFRVDYAIVPDGGHIDKIIFGEKGVIRLKIKSYGKQAHASTPDLGINAVEHLIRLLHKIRGLTFDELKYHESFSGITVNIGTIQGGHAANIVPSYADASIDIRFPFGIDSRKIVEKIHAAEKEFLSEEKNAKIEIEELLGMDAHVTDPNSDIVTALLQAANELGIKMRMGTMGGITDAKPLAEAGIETVVHSMDDGSDVAHKSNEFLVLENLRFAAALYCLTLEKLLRV